MPNNEINGKCKQRANGQYSMNQNSYLKLISKPSERSIHEKEDFHKVFHPYLKDS